MSPATRRRERRRSRDGCELESSGIGCWAMKPGRRLVASLVAFAMAGVAAGCGGGGDNTGEVMWATLTGDGCRYQGERRPPLGCSPSRFETRSSERASFHLIELPAGHDARRTSRAGSRRRIGQGPADGHSQHAPHQVAFHDAGRTPRDQRASGNDIHGKVRRPLRVRAPALPPIPRHRCRFSRRDGLRFAGSHCPRLSAGEPGGFAVAQ